MNRDKAYLNKLTDEEATQLRKYVKRTYYLVYYLSSTLIVLILLIIIKLGGI